MPAMHSETIARFPYTNKLVEEKSPYLMQHAHNPVDWFPWGQEAFAKARKEDKPVFLSIGYSTCHWCHVMERESFENEEIAAILNKDFIAIKVDREERPDVDKVYMTFVQSTTGGGGWPMNVWLTPGLKPFMGGTYYPPEDRWGRPGLKAILISLAESWHKDRERIVAAADDVTQQLMRLTTFRVGIGGALEKSLVLPTAGYRDIKASYEPRYGGFGNAPKFPRPVTLDFLLCCYTLTFRNDPGQAGTQDALDMALYTLRKMADGGIHDHIGGGFHRYSVDDQWHVPHFEKMLYDQAQLACSYLAAYQITRDAFYADTARDILEYVLRDMTGKDGQFYSAEDADSPVPGNPGEHAEGAFYVWTQKEIVEALGKDSAEVFGYVYGIESGGNAENDQQGEFSGKNILIVRNSVEDAAEKFGKSPASVHELLGDARARLRQMRAQRPRPYLDDKTIVAWNGLMISAFARGAQALDEPRYLEAAQKAGTFIEEHLFNSQTGRLFRRYRAGDAAIDGYVDDYAFLIQGLIDLYDAEFDVKSLAWAIDLQKKQDELFWDKQDAGYFSTAGDDPSVLLRMKEDYDGAEPSPNSIAAMNLLRLSQMTNDKALNDRAGKTLAAFGDRLKEAPSVMPQMLVAFLVRWHGPVRIVIAGKHNAPDTCALLSAIYARFIPNRILLQADSDEGKGPLAASFEFTEDVKMLDGKATAYICKNQVCQLPTSDLPTMIKFLDKDN